MKKRKASVLVLLAFLAVDVLPVEEKAPGRVTTVRRAGSGVCTSGYLNGEALSTKNLLPPGFYGNYPDIGVLEIGNRAGGIREGKVPPMHMDESGRYILTFRFTEGIQSFSDARYLGRVGYVLRMQTPDGLVEDRVLSDGTEIRLDTFLERNNIGDYYAPGFVSSPTSSVLMYSNEEKAFSVTFDYERDWSFESLTFYYADVPAEIDNVSLYENIYPQSEIYSAVYSGESCLDGYDTNVGTDPIFELKSQKGTVFAKDFLVHAFVARDENLPGEIHPIIEDPDNYFNEGMDADVGDTFTVFLRAEDDLGNVSRVRLNITIVDTKGPRIQKIGEESVTASYAEDLEEVIENSFIIRDNSNEKVEFEVKLENGNPIPQNRIGEFDAVLSARDIYGNETAVSFPLRLIDDVPPVLECALDEIVLQQGTRYSREKILSFFSAVDDIDGDVDILVTKDTYIGNEDVVGTYAFEVEATDSSGNTATKTIAIRVEDSEGPTFYVKDTFLTVVEGEIPSIDDVVEALIRQSVLENKNYVRKEIVEGGPLDDSLSIGVYPMVLLVVDEEGTEEHVSLTIEVRAKDSLQDPTLPEAKGFWARFCQFWIDLWEKIVAFFTGG